MTSFDAGAIAGSVFEANLVAAAAILVVILVRKPARKLLGARLAYGLWLLPLLAAAGALIPAREIILAAPIAAGALPPPILPVMPQGMVRVASSSAFINIGAVAFIVWVVGVMISAGLMLRLQLRFSAAARRGDVGPAVAGVFFPRIVTPSDFAERFDAEEQALILAHEQTHIARHHTRLNALITAIQCVCWFNPLIHLAAHLMRIDQEMACDETVITRFPTARRAYAQALVKAQLAIRPLPLGCYWPSGTQHPLLERIAMLSLKEFSRTRRLAGASGLALICAAAGAAAWAAQPAKIVTLMPPPLSSFPARPAVTAPRAADSPVLPAPAEPAPQAPAPLGLETLPQMGVAYGGETINPGAPRTVTGSVVRVHFQNPVSTIWLKDTATGRYVPVNTDVAANLVSAGVTRNVLGPGTIITARGYGSTDGASLFADPAEMTNAAGEPLAPNATRQANLPQIVSLRLSKCGTMPDSVWQSVGGPENAAAAEAAMKAWQQSCEAQTAAAAGRLGAPVVRSPTTNSVIREGAQPGR